MIDFLIYFGISYLSIVAIYSLVISWKIIKSLGFSFWAVGEFLLTFILVALFPIATCVYPIYWKFYKQKKETKERKRNELEAKGKGRSHPH